MPRKQKKYHYLYKTTNLINNKFYVGMHSTDNLDDGYLGSGKYLRRSINKYGKENFNREILEFFDTREILIEKEKDFVNKDFVKGLNCMNLRIGGSGIGPFNFFNLGLKRSEETKKKQSLIRKGKSYEEIYGIKRAKEIKQKKSDGNLGTFVKKVGEKKAKIWAKKIANSLTGKKASEKTIKILSEAHKGIQCSFKNKTLVEAVGEEKANEWKEKISKSLTGRKVSEETKIKHKNRIPWNRGKKINACWIFNETIEKSRKINFFELDTWLCLGWKKGRKMNWLNVGSK